MVTITNHIFTDIFTREYVLSLKPPEGHEKNMGFHLIQKSNKFGEKVEQIGVGSFKERAKITGKSISTYTCH